MNVCFRSRKRSRKLETESVSKILHFTSGFLELCAVNSLDHQTDTHHYERNFAELVQGQLLLYDSVFCYVVF